MALYQLKIVRRIVANATKTSGNHNIYFMSRDVLQILLEGTLCETSMLEFISQLLIVVESNLGLTSIRILCIRLQVVDTMLDSIQLLNFRYMYSLSRRS